MMSEKRFESRYNSRDGEYWVFDNKYDSCLLILNTDIQLHKLIILLNQMNEENEKLNSEMRTNLKEFSRLFKQNFAQKRKINDLQEENKRLKNKLNVTALELVDESISMGKAVEISEMNYHEFLRYRQKKGKPMELKK